MYGHHPIYRIARSCDPLCATDTPFPSASGGTTAYAQLESHATVPAQQLCVPCGTQPIRGVRGSLWLISGSDGRGHILWATWAPGFSGLFGEGKMLRLRNQKQVGSVVAGG